MLWGLISCVHPAQLLEEENNFEILGGAGDKVVQGLNNSSIYGIILHMNFPSSSDS